MQGESCYLGLTFQPWLNLYFGIYNLEKKCTVDYLLSDRLKARKMQSRGHSIVKLQSRLLRWCNMLPRSIEGDGELPGTHIDFLKGWYQLDWLEN